MSAEITTQDVKEVVLTMLISFLVFIAVMFAMNKVNTEWTKQVCLKEVKTLECLK